MKPTLTGYFKKTSMIMIIMAINDKLQTKQGISVRAALEIVHFFMLLMLEQFEIES
jgi:hypothetical protein